MLNARIEEADMDRLEALCHQTVRTKSDMIRFLIAQEYNRIVVNPNNSQEQEKQAQTIAA
jgi:hypothetical protein